MVLITHLAIRVVRLVSRSLSDRGSPDYIMWSPNHSSTSSSNSRISASVDPEPLMVFPGSGGEERGWCARDEQHGIVSTQFCIPRRSSCSSSASAFTSCCSEKRGAKYEWQRGQDWKRKAACEARLAAKQMMARSTTSILRTSRLRRIQFDAMLTAGFPTRRI